MTSLPFVVEFVTLIKLINSNNKVNISNLREIIISGPNFTVAKMSIRFFFYILPLSNFRWSIFYSFAILMQTCKFCLITKHQNQHSCIAFLMWLCIFFPVIFKFTSAMNIHFQFGHSLQYIELRIRRTNLQVIRCSLQMTISTALHNSCI